MRNRNSRISDVISMLRRTIAPISGRTISPAGRSQLSSPRRPALVPCLDTLEPRMLLSAAPVAANVNYIYYVDPSGRQINYKFTTGTMNSSGLLNIPSGSATTTALGETGNVFSLTPDGGIGAPTLSGGVYKLNLPQPATATPSIPTKDITVDGNSADWSSVANYITDATGDAVGGTGSDILSLKVAFSSNHSHLNFLIHLAGNVNPNCEYDLILDPSGKNDNDDNGYHEIDMTYSGGSWSLGAQPWDDADNAGIHASVVSSSQYIEGSILAADVGLSSATAVTNVSARTQNASLWYQNYDDASAGVGATESDIVLNGTKLSANPKGGWTLATSFSNFANVSTNQMGYRFGLEAERTQGYVAEPEVSAAWFTGILNGVSYNNALVLMASVGSSGDLGSSDQYDWDWSPPSGGKFLTGLNPATTKVDLKEVVNSSGLTASFYYRLNSSNAVTASDWTLLTSNTLPSNLSTTISGLGPNSQKLVASASTIPLSVPAVTSINPNKGPLTGGTSVTIKGTNLLGATAVDFGTKAGTIVSITGTQIVAKSPAGTAGAVDVRVVTAGGMSAASTADKFTYVAAPTVTSVSPNKGPLAGGTSVTIKGTNLLGAAAVNFGAKAGTIVSITATQIVAKSPASTAGTVDVKVVTAGGTSAASTADKFTYVAAPTVTGISPNKGPLTGGTSVTITGTNLLGATAVYFGTAVGTIVSTTATQIVVKSPAGVAGAVDVRVATAGGTSAATSADKLTYAAYYTLSVSKTGMGSGTVSLSPQATSYAAGTVVTLTANPATGSTFAGWSGSASGSAKSVTVTITKNTTVAANFNIAAVTGSNYAGTWIGQFNCQYEYLDSHGNEQHGSLGFNITMTMQSLVTAGGISTLTVTHVTSSDAYFGTGVSGETPSFGSAALLPSPPANSSPLAGEGIAILFANGTSLATVNDVGDLHMSLDGSLMSNGVGLTNSWSAGGGATDYLKFHGITNGIITSSTWSFTHSAL